jgi:hypothetical protein
MQASSNARVTHIRCRAVLDRQPPACRLGHDRIVASGSGARIRSASSGSQPRSTSSSSLKRPHKRRRCHSRLPAALDSGRPADRSGRAARTRQVVQTSRRPAARAVADGGFPAALAEQAALDASLDLHAIIAVQGSASPSRVHAQAQSDQGLQRAAVLPLRGGGRAGPRRSAFSGATPDNLHGMTRSRDGQDAVCLGGRKLRPGRATPGRCGVAASEG